MIDSYLVRKKEFDQVLTRLLLAIRLLVPLIGAGLLSGCSSHITRIQQVDNVRISGDKEIERAPSKEHKISRQLASVGIATSHLSESHARSLVLRPASSLASLALITSRTASDLVRDTALDLWLLPRLEGETIPEIVDGGSMDLERWERQLGQITGRQTQYGYMQLHLDGEEFFPRLYQAIEQTEQSVMIRSYIFDTDDVAVEVAKKLKEKSSQARVRVLYDGVGSIQAAMTDSQSQPIEHHPPSSISRYLQQDSAVEVRKINNPWLSGDHTKAMVFDNRLAFVGGMNVGREYRYDWHDLMLEITGPIVSQIAYDAERAWQRNGPKGDLSYLAVMQPQPNVAPVQEDYPVRLLYSSPAKREIYRAHLEAINRAKQYIYIENAYFSDDKILYALVKARRRGVDVRVVLSRVGNHPSMNRSTRVVINTLLKNGVRVYLYPEMTHVKAAIIDGWSCIGTANLDKLSFYVNRELNLATAHPEFVAVLKERLFERDFSKSLELRESIPVSFGDHIFERLADIAL